MIQSLWAPSPNSDKTCGRQYVLLCVAHRATFLKQLLTYCSFSHLISLQADNFLFICYHLLPAAVHVFIQGQIIVATADGTVSAPSKPRRIAATRRARRILVAFERSGAFCIAVALHLRTRTAAEGGEFTAAHREAVRAEQSRRGRLKDTGYTLHHKICGSQKAAHITALTVWGNCARSAVEVCKIICGT